MSLTKLEENLSIIENLPDAPTMESNELKQKFDEGSRKIKDYINETLTVEIDSIVTQIKKDISNKILEDNKKKYYVGKLIFDTKNVNPATYLGFGTWQLWGAGKVPVGVDTSQSEFNTVEKTGGEKTHKLTLAEIPSHTHTFKGNVTSSNGAHTHTLNNHTHSLSGTTSGNNVSVAGILSYGNILTSNTNNEGKIMGGALGNGWASNAKITLNSASTHTHTISGTTGSNNGNTSNSGAHTHTISGTNTNSGGDGTHNNLQPYITCYIWKRIA